ncbi:MAG: DNA oxidative demethylase AlkB [Steroidobacteraceae bacterium]
MTSLDLFQDQPRTSWIEALDDGAVVLRAFVHAQEAVLLREVAAITAVSPFRNLTTPGGLRMSVAMTNCGELGWVSDRSGYRYDAVDPLTQQRWPALPASFNELAMRAAAAAGYDAFHPEACLINRYEPGTRLSLHRDQDEEDASAPIVSVSVGAAATFLWGGLRRSDRTQRVRLESGDVVVWGGTSRFVYHGVAPLKESVHPLTGAERINLTFRRVRQRAVPYISTH